METAGCNLPSNDVVQTNEYTSQLSAPPSPQVPNSARPRYWVQKDNNAKSMPYFGCLPTNSFLPPPAVFPGCPMSCYGDGVGVGMPNYTQTLPSASTPLPLPLPLPLPYVTHLRLMICKQIDYYFSDDNLATDFYLKRQMDDEGWVPVTLIAGFRRVSKLSSDALFVRDSMIYSTTVEVQGERLRKRGSWKKWLLPKA